MTGPSFCLRKVSPDIRGAARAVKVKAILLRREQMAIFIQPETQSLGRNDTAVRPIADSLLR
jgi:hypothetical protein